MSTPVPITATVTPPPINAPRCAAASHPSARPLTTGSDVMQSIPQRFEDVAVGDELGGFEVGRGPRDAPGPVKAARGQTLPLRPAFEGESRPRLERGQVSQPAGPELRVEAALTRELSGSRRQDPFPDHS